VYFGGMEGSEGESRVVIFIRLNISSYCGGNAVETRWKRGGNAAEHSVYCGGMEGSEGRRRGIEGGDLYKIEHF
jgi:hypothetical protein